MAPGAPGSEYQPQMVAQYGMPPQQTMAPPYMQHVDMPQVPVQGYGYEGQVQQPSRFQTHNESVSSSLCLISNFDILKTRQFTPLWVISTI